MLLLRILFWPNRLVFRRQRGFFVVYQAVVDAVGKVGIARDRFGAPSVRLTSSKRSGDPLVRLSFFLRYVARLDQLTDERLVARDLLYLIASNQESPAVAHLPEIRRGSEQSDSSEGRAHPCVLRTLQAHLVDVKIRELDRKAQP